jgi:hypothetical protein
MAESDGFDAFYRDTSRRLLRYAYGLTGDPDYPTTRPRSTIRRGARTTRRSWRGSAS